VPVFLAAPEGFMRFWRFNSERSANFDSLWYLVEQVRGTPFPVPTLNLLSAGTLGLIAIVVLAVGTRRRPPEEWWSLALPLACAFLLTNKVYSPQYTLWVIPLAALSLRYAAPFLAFLVADLALFLIEFPFLGGLAGTRLGPSFTVFAVALLARATTLVWILVASTLDHDPSLTARARPEAPRPEDRITAYEPSRLGASSHLLAVVRQPAWARPSR
jgi:hypothetical protein